MHVRASVRRLLARRPWIYWLVVALAALGIAAEVRGHLARLDAERQRWGATASVWVAVEPSDPGQPLIAEQRDVPIAIVPDDPVHELAVDAVARYPVGAGEILVRSDVVGAGPSGLAPSGWIAIGISALAGSTVGDEVRVFSLGVALGDGLVIAVHDGTVLVALPADLAAAVSHAAADGTATLGLITPP